MNDIHEQLKEAILLLTDKQLDYVLKHIDEVLANEETREDQQKEARRYE